MTMPDVSSARQRLKLSVRLIERHLSDLNLIFNKDLLGILGEEGTQCNCPFNPNAYFCRGWERRLVQCVNIECGVSECECA